MKITPITPEGDREMQQVVIVDEAVGAKMFIDFREAKALSRWLRADGTWDWEEYDLPESFAEDLRWVLERLTADK